MVDRARQAKDLVFFRWQTNEKYRNFRLNHGILSGQLKVAYDRYLQNPKELDKN